MPSPTCRLPYGMLCIFQMRFNICASVSDFFPLLHTLMPFSYLPSYVTVRLTVYKTGACVEIHEYNRQCANDVEQVHILGVQEMVID